MIFLSLFVTCFFMKYSIEADGNTGDRCICFRFFGQWKQLRKQFFQEEIG